MTFVQVLQTVSAPAAAIVAACVAAVASLMPFAFSSIISARLNAAKRRRKDWERLSQLIAIVNNPEGGSGAWEQIIAIQELHDFHKYRSSITSILVLARTHFVRPEDAALREHLETLLVKLQKR